MKIGFIGAGKVGFSLGRYLTESNIEVVGYYSKNQHSSQEAALFTKTKYYDNLENLIDDSDTIFITTPDSCIKNVWNTINKFHIKEKIICHCSGSTSSEIFSNIEKYGAYGYSIHPMLAISSKYNSYKDFQNAFITIEGNEKHIETIRKLFESLGNKIATISKDNKTLYHAACVLVSNFMVGLINTGVEYLEKCEFSQEDAMRALMPLIEFNIQNIKSYGVISSLTGPVERADLGTIKEHCTVLENDDEILYKLLSQNILKLAMIKNSNRNYSDIEKFLGGIDEKYGCNIQKCKGK